MMIILDGNGVINYDSPGFIKTPDKLIFLPDSLDAISKLTRPYPGVPTFDSLMEYVETLF